MRKLCLPLAISAVTFSQSHEAMAMTMEQRMEAMERTMLQMQSKLERTEAKLEHAEVENKELKRSLTQIKPAAPGANALKSIDDKVAVLEQRMAFEKAAADETAKKMPKLDVSSKGMSVTSNDGNYKLNLRGYLQADNRFYLDQKPSTNTDNFLIRRARLTLDGTIFKNIDFRLSPDFAGSQVRLFDAFIDLHYFPGASLMAGKFRQPVSLERYQAATNTTFIERGYPAQLAPNRDVGVMIHGVIPYPGYKAQYTPQPVFKDFISYELGVFDGIRDNQSVQTSDSDTKDNNKEVAGRLFSHPFLHSGTPLDGLGIGIAGTWGYPKNNTLASLTSQGQQNIITYNPTTTSWGKQYRIYPQGYWYWKSFGVMAEYLLSSQRLRGQSGTTDVLAHQDNTAWQVNASYMLTGENNSFFAIKPLHAFDPAEGGWGAFQVATRFTELDIDDHSFKNFGTNAKPFYLANPTTSVSKAQSWALGLNWILNDNVKVMTNYEQTYFTGGAVDHSGIINRPIEKAVFSRVQLVF